MTISDSGLSLIKRFEGCKLTSYRDAVGVLTIGYGHTGSDVHAGLTITQTQADALLAHDAQLAAESVNKMVTVKRTQNQSDALTSFVFNLGADAMKRSTLLRLLNEGKYDYAADQFLAWDHAGGKVLPGLQARRAAERQLFLAEDVTAPPQSL